MKRRVLVIDDDPAVLQCTAFALRDLFEVEVDVAATGAEGLARLKLEKYDVLVTDLILSDTNGEVVVEQARQIRPGIPTVIITGVTEYMPSGDVWADHFVSKPFRLSALTATLTRALKQAESMTTPEDPAPKRASAA